MVYEALTLHKELQAVKGYWEQQEYSSSGKNTCAGYPILDVQLLNKHIHKVTLYS